MAKLTEAELKQQLKTQNFSSLYYLYGEEKLLVRLYTQKLQEKIIGKEPSDFNFHVFEDGVPLQEIATAIDILPFAEPCNYVVLSDYNIEKLSEEEVKLFFSLLEQSPESTTLVLTMPTFFPSGKKTARFRKLNDIISKRGSAVNFERKTPAQLKKQLVSWAEKRGNTLEPRNAEKIIQYSGLDLQTLQSEMTKLCAFAPNSEITPDMIEKLVTKNLEARVFDLADAVAKKDADRAFSTLDTLFYQREEPIAILAVLASSYIDIYRVRTALESGETTKTITNDFDYKRKEFRLNKAQSAGRTLSDENLNKCLDLFMQTNVAMNSSSSDKRLYLEKLIGELLIIG